MAGFTPVTPQISQSTPSGSSVPAKDYVQLNLFDDSGGTSVPVGEPTKSYKTPQYMSNSPPPTSTTSGNKKKNGNTKSKAVPSNPSKETVQVVPSGPSVEPDTSSTVVSQKAVYSSDDEADIAAIMAASVANPPSPRDLSGLQVGPGMSVELEPNEAYQVETSDRMLRNLSPFMIQVEPPLIYGEDGGFQNKKVNSVATDFSVGHGFGTDLTGYLQARKAINQSSLSGFNQNYGSRTTVQETVVFNGNGPLKNQSQDGSKTTDTGNIGTPAIADLYTAVDIARQLSAMINTPPLTMLVNPSTMSIAFSKVQQHQERTRHGFILQAWGEEQPKISITARCGAFISGGRGVQFASRRDSKAWQNLMSLFVMYKNAGYIHDTIGKSNAHLSVGSLSIRYDGWVYYGHMESFSFSNTDENTLGGVEFSMEFTASAIVDTAQQTFSVAPMSSPIPSLSDPRYQGMQNQSSNTAGEYSVGIDTNGNPILSTQGNDIGGAFLFMNPQSGVNPFPSSTKVPSGSKQVPPPPPSQTGFFQASATPVPGFKPVSSSQVGFVDPFRVRSTS